jgi:redox-sensitive bicupin YhaK (pirin superfamily)
MAKRNFTPFLVFDHFRFQAAQATAMGGFPDHPHSGQETVTYLLDTSVGGGIAHEDFMGGKGILCPGDLQFMIAGRGIVHAEMPVFENCNNDDCIDGEKESIIEGIQMWLDLPENKKESDPTYTNVYGKDVPVADLGDSRSVKVISGSAFGHVGPATGVSVTPLLFLDFFFASISERSSESETTKPIQLPLPKTYNAMVYVVSGHVQINDNASVSGPLTCVLFDQSGDGIELSSVADSVNSRTATADNSNVSDNGITSAARFIVVAGQALVDQAVVQRGPFVATTLERIRETERDFRLLENGFERARGWSSDIGKRASRLYRG